MSSALDELAPERVAVRRAIEQLRLTPVMFELGARPHPPRELYRAYLAQSHIFVGIYWQRYGWVAPGETVSGLEDEYLLSSGIPRLLYLKTPAPDREARLGELIERMRSEDSTSYRQFQTLPNWPGWCRTMQRSCSANASRPRTPSSPRNDPTERRLCRPYRRTARWVEIAISQP